ncbi:receptor-like protein kinase ANXUR1 [Nicotiana tomentosiformis]|uniref:receptor-like protein kinase ANXUR1 n=1 Tax=Nicotiana tomentosiformis TaxID=4098 RepID=UPI00051BEE08|nr:receptor-like protein kinase ANXUR1 [Nicotiana tomentosiformis]
MLTKIVHILLLFVCLSSISRSLHAAKGDDQNTLFLACGSENGGTDEDERKWEPDAKYLISVDKSVISQPESQGPSSPSVVPYINARIFQSESSYNLPVKNQTAYILLRLHFNPSPYPNFNISNSYVTVSAGKFTLLNNFSAFITAQAFSQSYIIKEYLLTPVNSPTLEIKIKPFGNSPFAFINGIEMITSPDLFFGPDPTLVGFDVEFATAQQTISVKDNIMELLYRVNVGGQYIPPKNDSGGLMRSWYEDTPYIDGAALGVTMSSNMTIFYDDLPTYVAPLVVYESCRSMGYDSNVNLQYNLTWVFNVDPGFSYLVRFHWCDFTIDATRVNSLVFNVYINGQIAEREMDLIAFKNGKKAVPLEKDYVTHIIDDKSGKDKLWIAVHPSGTGTEFANALVNGIEIFKMNAGNTSLAGRNPAISDLMKKQQEVEQSKKEAPRPFADEKKSHSTSAIITGAAGGVAAFGVAAVLLIVAYKRKKRTAPGAEGTTSWLPIYGNSHSSSTKSASGRSCGSTTISSDAASNCRYFSLAEIKQATKNFDESYVIGVGGFGKVYKGVIDGDTKVAIKRSNPSSQQGVNEFQTEIEMLSKLRHRHLVSLIGFCEENNEMVLVYDHMAHGTLREHLYKGNKTILSWKQRLEICIGAARGLHYLHTGAKYTIIHRDVKSTNILLNDKWVAKVSDFGLSKTGPNMNQGHVTTVVKGSFGYLDPEYFRRQQLTEKSDVYSFGVVLFEVLCARPALNPNLSKEQVSLADWALACQRKGNLEDIIDPQLKGKINPECLKIFARTAEKCLADNGIDRPSMGDVLWNLEYALQLEENPDGVASNSEATKNVDQEKAEVVDQHSLIAMHRSTLSLESETGDNNTDDVFSQIVNQTGR